MLHHPLCYLWGYLLKLFHATTTLVALPVVPRRQPLTEKIEQ
jgi:hypothetical protein